MTEPSRLTTAQRDAVCCSTRCRQARHRFNRDAGRAAPVAGGRALRLAYADPPYPGKARLYRGHPDYGGEVDHAALIGRLTAYDGWALSTSAAALPAVLALCPPGVRVAAWHRGERPTPSRWPLNAWEPVIYHGGRAADPPRPNGALQTRRVDSLVHGVSPLTTLPTRVTGTKPAVFCRWVFELLGAALGDTLDDLFPGSGAVTRAWEAFTADASPAARAERVVLIGVAITGRPVARGFDDGTTLEVTRVTTDGTPNACSMLYAASWRAASALGYCRLITYTQRGESGASLRAAGWRVIAERPPHAGWDRPSRPRQAKGTEHIHRTLWEAAS